MVVSFKPCTYTSHWMTMCLLLNLTVHTHSHTYTAAVAGWVHVYYKLSTVLQARDPHVHALIENLSYKTNQWHYAQLCHTFREWLHIKNTYYTTLWSEALITLCTPCSPPSSRSLQVFLNQFYKLESSNGNVCTGAINCSNSSIIQELVVLGRDHPSTQHQNVPSPKLLQLLYNL